MVTAAALRGRQCFEMIYFFTAELFTGLGEEIWLESANGGIAQRRLRRRGDESSLKFGYGTFGDETACGRAVREKSALLLAAIHQLLIQQGAAASLRAGLSPGFWLGPALASSAIRLYGSVLYRAIGIPPPWLFIRPWGLGCSFSPSSSLPADFNTKSIELSSQPYFLLQQYNIMYVFHVVKRLLSLTAMGKVQVCRKHW